MGSGGATPAEVRTTEDLPAFVAAKLRKNPSPAMPTSWDCVEDMLQGISSEVR